MYYFSLFEILVYNGQKIVYDAIGNPLTYRDGFNFTWNYGRSLETINKTGLSATYNYNDSGIRTSKILNPNTTNEVKTDYYLDGDKIIRQSNPNYTLDFFYDEQGKAYGFDRIASNGYVEHYYYVRNLQNDIIEILNEYGESVCKYNYDAWGNVISITGMYANSVGKENPLRYRGYYYDEESKLYYLNSRYYDPVTGRFINADKAIQTGQGLLDKNMFAYCMNNPVMSVDPSGMRQTKSEYMNDLCRNSNGALFEPYYYNSLPDDSPLIITTVTQVSKPAQEPTVPATVAPQNPVYAVDTQVSERYTTRETTVTKNDLISANLVIDSADHNIYAVASGHVMRIDKFIDGYYSDGRTRYEYRMVILTEGVDEAIVYQNLCLLYYALDSYVMEGFKVGVVHAAEEIAINSEKERIINYAGDTDFFKFVVNDVSQDIEIYTRVDYKIDKSELEWLTFLGKNEIQDTVGMLYDGDGKLIEQSDNNPLYKSFDDQFYITIDKDDLTLGKTYYLGVRGWGEKSGKYELNVKRSNYDKDGDKTYDYEDIEQEIAYKTPAILLHGRTDNSDACFGAKNGIEKGDNDNWDTNTTTGGWQSYTSVDDQRINDIPALSTNLAYRMKNDKGYKENFNLFAFNFPNKDAISRSAVKLNDYIENLKKEGYLFKTKANRAENKHEIDLIGHSAGGLVSRYYIENIGKDKFVRKLVTMNTPHWGSDLAISSCNTGFNHVPMDHDLHPNSKMYGLNNDLIISCNKGDCGERFADPSLLEPYQFTDELKWNKTRDTDYYAIASIDGPTVGDITSKIFPCFSSTATYGDLLYEIQKYPYMTNNLIYNDLTKYDDDVVNVLSQIGWNYYGVSSLSGNPSKKIDMEQTWIYIDYEEINTLWPLHQHGQNTHRSPVINKVLEMLDA
jgi:RHS repeat-associated protein